MTWDSSFDVTGTEEMVFLTTFRQIAPKNRLTLQLTIKDCKGVNFIEHVQAKITLTSQRRGDIQIFLISPAGTRVTLLTSR